MLSLAYLVEIFPFTVRAKGIAMYQFWLRSSNFINTLINPIGMDSLKWKFYIWYCAWIAFEALCIYFLFPETSGRTLEELAFMFEGKEASEEMQKRTEYILGPMPSSASDMEEEVVYNPKCADAKVENA